MNLRNLFIYVLFAEIIFGGLGKFFGLPLRISIFAVTFLISLYYLYKDRVQIKRRSITYIAIIFVFVLFGSIIGLIRGNAIRDIITNINVFISILYVVILVVLINKDKQKINKLVDLFVIYNCIIGGVLFLVFKISNVFIMQGIDIVRYFNKFEEISHYGLISGYLYSDTYPRLYITNGIFLQIALAICLIKLAYKNEMKLLSRDNLKLFLIIIGIISTGTRGYWIGVAVVLVLLPIFIMKSNKKKLIINLGFVVMISAIAFIDLSPLYSSDNSRGGFMQNVLERANSTTEFSNNEISNNLRSVQFDYMMEEVKKHPIIGSGFGARIEAYDVETGRGSLNFELYYLELLFKTGIVGILILVSAFVHLIYSSYIMIKNKLDLKDEIVLKGWTLGLVSVLVSGGTNPYLAGSHGFFVIVFLIVILDLYER